MSVIGHHFWTAKSHFSSKFYSERNSDIATRKYENRYGRICLLSGNNVITRRRTKSLQRKTSRPPWASPHIAEQFHPRRQAECVLAWQANAAPTIPSRQHHSDMHYMRRESQRR